MTGTAWELLERGPTEAVKAALRRFEERERKTVAGAALLAERFGIALPQAGVASCAMFGPMPSAGGRAWSLRRRSA